MDPRRAGEADSPGTSAAAANPQAVQPATGAPAPAGSGPRSIRRRHLLVGHPRWARPGLLGVTALAAVAYSRGITSDGIEAYYAAGVRSMAGSWHDFLYDSFDPRGLLSLDKLPGGFWAQALSVHVFGLSVWALVLPQVIWGILAVLVLFRAVRRIAGPAAGLAFQAKMTEAWLIAPALALTYFASAPAGKLRKAVHLLAAGRCRPRPGHRAAAVLRLREARVRRQHAV